MRRSRTPRGSSTTCAPSTGAELVALVRELPDGASSARKGSLRSHPDGVDVSAIARSFGGGGHTPRGRLLDRPRDGRDHEPDRRGVLTANGDRLGLMPIPKALEPTGVILVDKPAGPSSFQIVARVRGRTGAKTGHAGTLDPFATGLLVLLSGRATSLQDRFMKLDKRYVTDVDLRVRTTTGDPEGDVVEEHEPPTREELESALDGLRGEVELPIPAASAVKIGGERAYRLHRQGVVVEMPTRVMRVHGARARSRTRTASRGSTSTSARGPTSARSPTRSAATASRCGGPRSGRSASRRPTSSAVVPLEEALPRLAAAR